MSTDLADRIAALDADTRVARRTRRTASLRWPWRGQDGLPAWHRIVVPSVTGDPVQVSTLLSFDVGPHASGWWRNSEYERCWHLSLAARDSRGFVDLPRDDLMAWTALELGDDRRMAWTEPPAGIFDQYRNVPASRFTTHVRLFCDQQNRPIQPTGEVYTLVPFADGSSPAKVFR